MAVNSYLAQVHRFCNSAIEPMDDHLSAWPKWKLSYICQHCEEPNELIVDKELYCRWAINNELVQNVWPHLSPEQREEITHCLHVGCNKAFYDSFGVEWW